MIFSKYVHQWGDLLQIAAWYPFFFFKNHGSHGMTTSSPNFDQLNHHCPLVIPHQRRKDIVLALSANPCVRPEQYLQYHWTELCETLYVCTRTHSTDKLFFSVDAKWPTGSYMYF